MAGPQTSEEVGQRPDRPCLHRLAEQVGELTALDAPAEAVARKVRSLVPKGPVNDAISGTFLGTRFIRS